MKKIKIILFSCVLALIFTSCASTRTTSGIGNGVIVTNVTEPVALGNSSMSTTNLKTGTATSVNILGIIVSGDSSISAAAKNGQIKNIQTVDKHVFRILSIYGSVQTIVTGE